MKQQITFCDMCGRTGLGSATAFNQIRINDMEFDLCPECHDKIIDPLVGKGRPFDTAMGEKIVPWGSPGWDKYPYTVTCADPVGTVIGAVRSSGVR